MSAISRHAVIGLAAVLLGSCSVGTSSTAPTTSPPRPIDTVEPGTAPPTPVRTPTPSPAPPPTAGATSEEDPVVLLAAGDIAGCDRQGDEATAALLDQRPGTVAALGDLAYPDGSAAQLADCYGPSWGRHLDRTRPALGNHDYGTGDADPYFDLFGDAAGPRGEGYYGYDLSPSWHAVVLNTNCWAVGGCDAGSPQYLWLEEELDAHRDQHVVAYGHHPRFSSGHHGSNGFLDEVFGLLDRLGVDLYLAGHDHHYERFTPADGTGQPSTDGVRQFVVGTGGYVRYALGPELPITETRTNDAFGVLELTLGPHGYRWAFHPTDADVPADAGETRLVGDGGE